MIFVLLPDYDYVYQPIPVRMTFMFLYTNVVTAINLVWPIPVAARSKASVCGRSLTEIAGSNPARGHVCLYFVMLGRGLCDGLIPHPEESYRVAVCVIE
jgi:hypothetical protein